MRPSPVHGRGLFAAVAIPAGVVVSRLGGRLVGKSELDRLLAEPGHAYIDTITVGRGVHLVLPGRTDNGYGNHSCAPTTWWAGHYELVTRSAVRGGEELTNDYATSTDDPGFVLACGCGSPDCRGTITGDDWRRPELQESCRGHWVPALQVRIDGQRLDREPPSTGSVRPVK